MRDNTVFAARADWHSPIVGGFIAQYKTWHWTQWCMLFITLSIFLMALPMKETYKPIILKRRAKKLGLESPVPQGAGLKRTLVLKFARPMHMLFTEVSHRCSKMVYPAYVLQLTVYSQQCSFSPCTLHLPLQCYSCSSQRSRTSSLARLTPLLPPKLVLPLSPLALVSSLAASRQSSSIELYTRRSTGKPLPRESNM